MNRRLFIVMSGLLLSLGTCDARAAQPAGGRVLTYYAPEEDLELIDGAIIDQVLPGSLINIAAYVLSDDREIEAFARAAKRGVRVRIYLDPEELKHLKLGPDHPLVRLSGMPGVEIRIKAPGDDPMHLKGFSINGQVVRTGSANLSVSGLRYQDNDLILIYSPAAAQKFDTHFEAMWQRPGNQPFAPKP